MTNWKSKPIKVFLADDPSNLPFLSAFNVEEQSHLIIQEMVRIGREFRERIESLFRAYGIDPAGDPPFDFRNLALRLAEEFYPEFHFEENPNRIDLLMPLYGVRVADGGAYAQLVIAMAQAKREDLLPKAEQQPYRHKPSDPRMLLWLLADVNEINRGRRQPHSDNAVIDKLMTKEPYKARWEDVNENTLRNWLVFARKLVKSVAGERPENQGNET